MLYDALHWEKNYPFRANQEANPYLQLFPPFPAVRDTTNDSKKQAQTAETQNIPIKIKIKVIKFYSKKNSNTHNTTSLQIRTSLQKNNSKGTKCNKLAQEFLLHGRKKSYQCEFFQEKAPTKSDATKLSCKKTIEQTLQAKPSKQTLRTLQLSPQFEESRAAQCKRKAAIDATQCK